MHRLKARYQAAGQPGNKERSKMYPTIDESTNNKKRLVVVLVVLLFLVLFAVAINVLIQYLTTTILVVNTNNPKNKISVVESVINNANSHPLIYNTSSSHSIRVSLATYIITVSNQNGLKLSRVVTVKRGQISTVNMALDYTLLSPEAVASVSPSDITVGNSQILYLNKYSDLLYSINSSNELSSYGSTTQFSYVDWLNPAFGVGQTSNNTLYQINSGKITRLPIQIPNNVGVVSYSVAPNKNIYVAIGKEIYMGSPTSSFKKIYTSPYSPITLDAGQKYLAIKYNPGNDLSNISILEGTKLVASKNIEAYLTSWSPNGDYLLTTRGLGSQILNSSLTSVGVVPNSNLNSPVWLSNSEIIYGSSNQLWQYNINTQQSYLMARTLDNHAIEQLTLNPSSSYVYALVMGTNDNSNSTSVIRFGLNNQPIPALAVALAKDLPWISGYCSLGYINFTSPTVLIRSFFTPMPASCQHASLLLPSLGIKQPVNVQYSNVIEVSN